MKVLFASGIAFFVSLLVAEAVFCRADPQLETKLPQLKSPPTTRHNLVARAYGPVVRASSADWFSLHHPAYVVDGRLRASPLEKWASAAADRRPWISVSWGTLRNVDEVRLAHAGVAESSRLNNRIYTLVCMRANKVVQVYPINNVSAQAVTPHAVDCKKIDELRVEFNELRAHERSRLYEVEVFGS